MDNCMLRFNQGQTQKGVPATERADDPAHWPDHPPCIYRK